MLTVTTTTCKTVLLASGVVVTIRGNTARLDVTAASTDQLDEAYDHLPEDAELVGIDYPDGREIHRFTWGKPVVPQIPGQQG